MKTKPRRRPVWMLALLAMTAAGCVADEPAEPPPPADDGESRSGMDPGGNGTDAWIEIPWGLHECRAAWWLAPANADALREHLPDGFEPAGPTQFPGFDAAGYETYLGFDAFLCQSGQGLNGSLEAIAFGSVFTRVTPPADQAFDGREAQSFYRWELLVDDQPRHDVLSEMGLSVHTGDVRIEAGGPGASPGPWETRLVLDGLGTFGFSGSTLESEATSEDIELVTYTPAGESLALIPATATNLSSALGHGAWSVEPGTWVYDVLGAESGVGTFAVGTWSITDARLLMPK